jgi:hypothetical protein
MSKTICSLNQAKTTCLPNTTLQLLSNNFLESNNKSPIKIVEELSNKFKCNREHNTHSKELCIMKEIRENTKDNNLKKSIEKQVIKYFKPKAKSVGGNYWINNTEIDNIQFQLQCAFPGYYYSYIHMIDLEMFNPNNQQILLHNEKIYNIKDINFVNELNKNNNKFTYNGDLKYYGTVWNTDLSTNSGLHWFALFIDFTNKPITIEYFNSSGLPLTEGTHVHKRKEFLKFLQNLADELSKAGHDAKFIQVTNKEHQKDNTANCGSYSLFYIWSRLNGKPFTDFNKDIITDEEMEKFRTELWRT